nr:hypothetical protein [Rhizorhabdus dicambivorans]
MTKYILAGLIVVLVIAGGWTWSLLNHYNHFDTVVSDRGFECAPVPGTQGGEDIAVDWKHRQAFISSGGLIGDLRRYDIDRGGEAVKLLPPDMPVPTAFRGHGISLYAPEKGPRKLFAVNHGGGHDQITIFGISPEGKLSLEENIRDELLYDANDIQAVGSRQFYVVNSTHLGGSRYKNPIGALRFLGAMPPAASSISMGGSFARSQSRSPMGMGSISRPMAAGSTSPRRQRTMSPSIAAISAPAR